MKGIKPYLNTEGKVFEVIYCRPQKDNPHQMFDKDSVMGSLLLGVQTSATSDLDNVLARMTKYSGKRVKKVTKDAHNSIKARDVVVPKAECQHPLDPDDRLIYTYRPFSGLASPSKRKTKANKQ